MAALMIRNNEGAIRAVGTTQAIVVLCDLILAAEHQKDRGMPRSVLTSALAVKLAIRDNIRIAPFRLGAVYLGERLLQAKATESKLQGLTDIDLEGEAQYWETYKNGRKAPKAA